MGKFTESIKARYKDKAHIVMDLLLLLCVVLCLVCIAACGQGPLYVTTPLIGGNDGAVFDIVESLPTNLPFTSDKSTFDCWKSIIQDAESTIDIAAYYFSLLPTTTGNDIQGSEGEEIFNLLSSKITNDGVKVRIAINPESESFPFVEVNRLMELGAEVMSVDFSSNSGILHTKFIVSDKKHVYLGSANMDWKALQGVKELGMCVRNSEVIAEDVEKIFEKYWHVGEFGLPSNDSVWKPEYDTLMWLDNAGNVHLNGKEADIYIGESPAQMLTLRRTWDLLSMQNVLTTTSFENGCARLEVMDYGPITMYSEPEKYFGILDDAIRQAGFSGCVNFLISYWSHSETSLFPYIESLSKAQGVVIRMFEIPSMYQPEQHVDYVGVSHSKYIVVDDWALISTSNFIGDYWVNTAGVTVAVSEKDIVDEMRMKFDRDWESQYAKPFDLFKQQHPELFA